MKLIENLSQEKYEKFCRENKHNSHFLHSYVWGKFQEKERNVIREREKGKFISIEDVQKRAKISQTLIDKMKEMGILKDLPDSNQLSLF